MSIPPGYHPPPPPPAYWGGPPPPRSNAWAITTLVLGILALLVCWIPVLNLVSVVAGLVGVGTGATGVVVGRRRGVGVTMAGIALVVCVVAVVAAIVVTVLFGRALFSGEVTDDDVPAATASLGEPVRVGDLEFEVHDVGVCAEHPGMSTAVDCPLELSVTNLGDETVRLRERNLRGVVDDSYVTVSLTDGVKPPGFDRLAPGERADFDAVIEVGDPDDDVTDVVVSDGDVEEDGGTVIAVD